MDTTSRTFCASAVPLPETLAVKWICRSAWAPKDATDESIVALVLLPHADRPSDATTPPRSRTIFRTSSPLVASSSVQSGCPKPPRPCAERYHRRCYFENTVHHRGFGLSRHGQTAGKYRAAPDILWQSGGSNDRNEGRMTRKISRATAVLGAVFMIAPIMTFGGASASSASAATTTRVLTCTGKVVSRPSTFVLSCADANAGW